MTDNTEKKYQILFQPCGKLQGFKVGSSLLTAAQQADIPLKTTCSGRGKCGQCRVHIKKGATPPLSDNEKTLLSQAAIENGERLACLIPVTEDMEIYIPKDSIAADTRHQIKGVGKSVNKWPHVVGYDLDKTLPIRDHSQIVLVCPTVLEVIRPFLTPEIQVRSLDFVLHTNPVKHNKTLQSTINEVENDFDTIILCYGMCANGIIGLQSAKSYLIVPRVADCIAIFLGSNERYQEENEHELGTFYLTKSWLEVCDTPLDEYKKMAQRYGKKRADNMLEVMFQHYKRLGYIITGDIPDQGKYQESAREIADHLELRYEEIQGSTALAKKMIQGPWDNDFIVCPPGQTIKLTEFLGRM